MAETRRDPKIMLGLLASIEQDSGVTQRELASGLGIALGLANAYLRRCVHKGFVKMCEVPLHRYAYYLTPQGFSEKSRLVAEYLATSFDFFRQARRDCTELFQHGAAQGWRRVVLYGAGELAEIAVLSVDGSGVEIACIIDADAVGRQCAGLAVVPDLTAALARAAPARLDGIVLTDTRDPQGSFERLCALIATHDLMPAMIAAPRLLGISRPG